MSRLERWVMTGLIAACAALGMMTIYAFGLVFEEVETVSDDIRKEVVQMMAEPPHVQMTAMLIANAIEKLRAAMGESGLTQVRLEGFRDYAAKMESVGFVIDPTAYRDVLYADGFEEFRRRMEVLDTLADYFKLPEGIE